MLVKYMLLVDLEDYIIADGKDVQGTIKDLTLG